MTSILPLTSAAKASSQSHPQGDLRILSWNVDNPAPYLEAVASSASGSSTESPLTKYFKPAQPSPGRKGKSRNTTAPSSPLPTSPAGPSLRSIFKAHGWPDVVCLQEVRALAKDSKAISLLRKAANWSGSGSASTQEEAEDTDSDGDTDLDASSPRKGPPAADDGGPSYEAHFSLCKAHTGSGRFGVAMYISSALLKKLGGEYSVREVTWDNEGRVLVLELPAHKLAILNIYALNGSDYAWKDPLTGVARGTRNERKREFNRLLSREVRGSLLEKGYRVAMVGDWNISREKRDCFPRLRTEEPHARARKEFNEVFMPSLDVVDIFREMHGDKRSYSWFSRHKPDRSDAARVDYALLSRSLVGETNEIEYLEEPKWRYRSDHAPLKLVNKVDKANQGT